MAPSSCSPSSSAVTIPIPGKSILKRPPAQPPSLFSRFTRLLPSPSNSHVTSPTDEGKTLKRAHFILPRLVTVYPISSLSPPSTPNLKEEKKAIEEKEAERRSRIVKGGSPTDTPNIDGNDWWTLDKVESFYRECCAGSEEEPDPAISFAFKNAIGSQPRAVDLSGVQLNPHSGCILSDVFMIEWGLKKLALRECDLDEHSLKPILHALLIPNSLTFLSVASNRRLKTPAFRFIGAYVAKAHTLQFLDLSQNALDKKAVEYVTSALPTAPEPGLASLKLDDCSLRPAALEALARAVRTSSLRNISLRYNRISTSGAVAIALMIRDYPDVVPPTPTSPSFTIPSSTDLGTPPSTPNISASPLLSPTAAAVPSSALSRPPLPPPRHPATLPQTTYTPYIPRSRRNVATAAAAPQQQQQQQQHPPNPLSTTGQPIPIITSSSQGGVTTRHPVPSPLDSPATMSKHVQGPSAALLDKVRALDALPRLGALRILDLRGNDIRTGVTYIAQVLKRNRTLKVLNLSENKLDVQGLVYIAEALKYNSCLETLDLGKNPCAGPGLEGIQSLRTAFTLNTALKRLFLSSTSMTSTGAIALAEFLPESTSLLHLDLTMNHIDLAGVMALSSGLKANHIMRCLDLNIPPGDEEFARMCRDILNSCVRNTEEAEKTTRSGHGPASGVSGRGQGKGVWGMIEESALVKVLQKEVSKIDTDIVTKAITIASQLRTSESVSESATIAASSSDPAVFGDAVTESAKSVLQELVVAVQSTTDPVRLQELLAANDELTAALEVVTPAASRRPILTLQGLGNHVPHIEGSGSGDHEDAAGNDAGGNGQATCAVEEPDSSPTTPRVDKGKAKAEPQPPEPEKVLSPRYMIDSDDEEEEDPEHARLVEGEGVETACSPSPTDRSRIWVAEEGEVFRKGAVLLGPEEMEGDYAGEELRRELLEAMVERPPPRSLDEFSLADLGSPLPPALDSAPPPTSPVSPPLRPYLTRSRSSPSPSPTSPIGQSAPLRESPSLQSVASDLNSTASPLAGPDP